MRLKYFYVWLILVSNNHSINSGNNKFVIGPWAAGFFSAFLGVLNNLNYADRHNKIPVIEFSVGNFIYKQTGGYNGSINPWEYYFEPVSNLTYQSGDTIYSSYFAPDNTYIIYNSKAGYAPNIRIKWHQTIQKYIKIKPNIMAKIEFFYENYIAAKTTIGIHLRGTDKNSEVRQISPEIILTRANNIARNLGGNIQFLVATDELKLLNLAKSKLNGPVIYYNATRYYYKSINGIPVHYDPNIINKALLGEEVLIEANLLARCNILVHTLSNVSQAVAYFNPALKLETVT